MEVPLRALRRFAPGLADRRRQAVALVRIGQQGSPRQQVVQPVGQFLEQPAEQLRTDLRQPGQGTRGVGQRRRQLVEQLVLEVFLQQRSGRLFADQQAQAQRGAPTAAAFQQCPGRSGIGAAPVRGGAVRRPRRHRTPAGRRRPPATPFQQQPRQGTAAAAGSPATSPPVARPRSTGDRGRRRGRGRGAVGNRRAAATARKRYAAAGTAALRRCPRPSRGRRPSGGGRSRGPALPAQRQPDHLHARRRPPRAFSEEDGLAAAGGRAEQSQAAFAAQQRLVQTGPRQVLRRQPRQGGGQLGRLGHGSALVLSKRLAGSLDRACPLLNDDCAG